MKYDGLLKTFSFIVTITKCHYLPFLSQKIQIFSDVINIVIKRKTGKYDIYDFFFKFC